MPETTAAQHEHEHAAARWQPGGPSLPAPIHVSRGPVHGELARRLTVRVQQRSLTRREPGHPSAGHP